MDTKTSAPPLPTVRPTEIGRALFDFFLPLLVVTVAILFGMLFVVEGHVVVGGLIMVPVSVAFLVGLPLRWFSRLMAGRIRRRGGRLSPALQSCFEIDRTPDD